MPKEFFIGRINELVLQKSKSGYMKKFFFTLAVKTNLDEMYLFCEWGGSQSNCRKFFKQFDFQQKNCIVKVGGQMDGETFNVDRLEYLGTSWPQALT